MAIEVIRRWWPWALFAVLVLALLLAGPAACKRAGRLAAEQRISAEQQSSVASSARDAIGTIGQRNVNERESDALSISNEREIRDAQEASQPVDPAATGAGLDGLCRRAAYRDSERCRLRGADSG